MRLIDGDAFKTWIDEYVSVFKKSDNKDIKGYIEHQPTIDIVWCKECRHWWVDDDNMICHIHYDPTVPEHFCSYGEHKEIPSAK